MSTFRILPCCLAPVGSAQLLNNLCTHLGLLLYPGALVKIRHENKTRLNQRDKFYLVLDQRKQTEGLP